jgi:hypothetical protein
MRSRQLVLLVCLVVLVFLSTRVVGALAAPTGSPRTQGGTAVPPSIRLPVNGAVITFGRSGGIVAGFCSQAPGLAPAYSVSVFATGRVVARGALARSSSGDVAASTIRRLLSRARRDHFFHVSARMSDTSCVGAATVYVRIQTGGKAHTVEVYGYVDSRHPALRDLLVALQTAIGL